MIWNLPSHLTTPETPLPVALYTSASLAFQPHSFHLKTIAPAVLTAWRTLQTLRSLCAGLLLIQASAQMAPWRRFLHALAQAVPCLPTPIPSALPYRALFYLRALRIT